LQGTENSMLSHFAPTHLIHCAGVAHRRVSARSRAQREYLYEINVCLVRKIALLADLIGVKRFTYVSTVGVHGSHSTTINPITETSPIRPHNLYSFSKYEAECALVDILSRSSCSLTILRPALVYGPGAPGNIRSLTRAIDMGLPLPLRAIYNSRSLVYIGNLVRFISYSSLGSATADKAYVVSDCETISTEALVSRIALLRGRDPRLFCLPKPLSSFVKLMPLVGYSYSQLVDSLVVDSSLLRADLHLSQPFTQEYGLVKTFCSL
jgi:nucleoside-diphosphate-sugar epimerase